ncbi:MAG: L,D-transpeptidase, partial [Patescibacteria group bacterium]
FISSGLAQLPTPTGSFNVAKVPSVWYAGQDYDYGQVANNLRFKPHYFLHTAYWHKDFGHRRSHGCVNIAKANNDWLYGWAGEGTTVTIRD